MSLCPVCLKNNSINILKTVGDQLVCSISCAGLLKSNEKDSCDYCYRPVWRDNYYKINNKYYCSEICKNIIIKELNIPNDSKSILHFQENIFSNNNENILLKNSKQLREEVLKFYKDFHFDAIQDEEEKDNNYYSNRNNNSKRFEIENRNKNIDKSKNFKKITLTRGQKVKRVKNLNLDFNTTNGGCDSKTKYCKTNDFSDKKNKNSLTKAMTSVNIQKNISKTKTIDKGQKPKNNNINYTPMNDNKFFEISNFNQDEYSQYKEYDNLSKYANNRFKNYSFIQTTDNNNKSTKSDYNTINNNKSNSVNKKVSNYLNLSRSSKSPIIISNNKKECINCGAILGNAKILDRNNNAFCSDYCKDYFLKYYY